MNAKYILLVALCCSAASADEVVAVDRIENTVELDNGAVIQLDDVSDINVGDDVTLQKCDEFEECTDATPE